MSRSHLVVAYILLFNYHVSKGHLVVDWLFLLFKYHVSRNHLVVGYLLLFNRPFPNYL